MTNPRLPAGKLPVELLRQLLHRYRRASDNLLLPPGVGEDAEVIGTRGGALVAATDPITLTGREVGGHAVAINANDVAVMGVLASGALLAAFPGDLTDQAQTTLEAEGYATAILARAESGKSVRTSDGRPIRRYEQDEVSRILAKGLG